MPSKQFGPCFEQCLEMVYVQLSNLLPLLSSSGRGGGGGWGGVVVLAIPQTKAQSLFVRSRCLAGAANTCVIQHSALSAAHKKWGIQFHGILHDLLY